MKIDGETNGTTSESISWDEGVGNCCLLLGLDGLDVVDGGKVLEVEGEVHGVSERSFHAVHDHLLVSFVGESYQKLGYLTSGKL